MGLSISQTRSFTRELLTDCIDFIRFALDTVGRDLSVGINSVVSSYQKPNRTHHAASRPRSRQDQGSVGVGVGVGKGGINSVFGINTICQGCKVVDVGINIARCQPNKTFANRQHTALPHAIMSAPLRARAPGRTRTPAHTRAYARAPARARAYANTPQAPLLTSSLLVGIQASF